LQEQAAELRKLVDLAWLPLIFLCDLVIFGNIR
jgi:hypothetical protein